MSFKFLLAAKVSLDLIVRPFCLCYFLHVYEIVLVSKDHVGFKGLQTFASQYRARCLAEHVRGHRIIVALKTRG